MTTSLHSRSSWISEALYKATPDGSSYLAIVLKDSACPVGSDNRPIPTAYLYGPDLPSWVPGLLVAGTGKRSPGLAYQRLVKGKYQSQKVQGETEIYNLRRMLK